MNHLTLYDQLVSDAMRGPEVSTVGNNSVIVDGIMRGMVKQGRVVLNFEADRVAELVRQNLGAVYEANAAQSWLAVDPGVDEATFRQLFGEATQNRNIPPAAKAKQQRPHHDSTADLAEFSQKIAADILTLPDLSDPKWDTYSMVAEVSDNRCAITAYRYTESGPPVPTHGPRNSDLFWALRNRTRGTDGEAWDVVLVKIHRDTANLVLNFVRGEPADFWRVNPQNMAHLPEALRPRPEDFQEVDETEDIVERFQALAAVQNTVASGPVHPEIPLVPVPVKWNEDSNYVIGDRMDTTQSTADWPEVDGRKYAVWAGRAVNGTTGLLVRAERFNAQKQVTTYEAISLVRLNDVTRRGDRTYQARLESVPLGPAGDLNGVIDWADLRDLIRRAADRDPAFVTGWRRRVMRAPQEVARLTFHDVGEDLLRRLAMPLSTRIELMTRPERDRFRALIVQLREIADGTPPQPQRAQRLDRQLVDLPMHGVPVRTNVWLTPGNVSTISASGALCNRALAASWLAFTTDPIIVGRAVMLTQPLRRSDKPNVDGNYWLTTDQIRPAIVRAVVPGEAGSSLVELAAAPSAAEGVNRGVPEPREQLERVSAYLELLGRAYSRNTLVVGTATGAAHRLWQAGRFTSLRALMSWQIGQLGFGAQTVLDLQAIAWPERLRALTLVLQGVADGRPLAEVTAEAAGIASTALRRN